ncbi:MAG TPA: FAD-dependent oxidoreductase [Acidimicrobiales bacterium]|jgi:sarcosine oxidase|nr:FAD-dependent oxidoreductase [Acidimicrobiales bacterium]
MTKHKVDVVVIGAGAMGSATAWWLARDRADVALFEQFAPGHHRGSSHGGSRIFRLAYDDPFFVRMAQAALLLWRELEDDAGEPLLDITGSIDHGDSSSVDAVAAALDECDVEYERLAVDAARDRWPAMRFEGDVLFHPGGGRCHADATVRALQRRAGDHGAAIQFDARAALRIGSDAVEVDAAGDTWSAPVAVVTAGAWVQHVLGERAPDVRVTQEQVQHFRPVVEQDWPSFIHHRDPWVYGLLTPGEGVKVDEHHVGPVIDPDRRVERSASLQAAAVRYVEKWFPGLDPTPIHTAECLYTSTPDESFVLERVGPVVIGSPCSGHGFKFTPYIGRRLADLAKGLRG